MRFRRRVQDVPGASAMGGRPVRVRRHADDAVAATAQTDAEGWIDVRADGHPGPFYAEVDGPGGSGRATSARVAGMVGGFSLLEIPDALRALGDGVVTKAGTLTATVGVGAVTVSPHLALVRGYPCRLYSPRSFEVAPGTRTDRVVWRVWTSGGEVGRAELAYLEGASPTQTADLWEEPLVEVAVAGSAVSAAVVARGIPTHRKTETAIARSSAQASPASGTAEAVAAFDTTLTLPDAAVYDVLASFGGVASGEIDVAVRVAGDTGTYRVGSAAESLFTARNAHSRSGANGIQGPASVPVQVMVKQSASYVAEHTEVVSEPTEVEVTSFEHVRSIATGAGSAPHGVALATDEASVYVTDTAADQVRQYTVAGSLVRTFGGPGSTNGKLSVPRGIDVRGSNLHVADTSNDRIQAFSLTGVYQTKYGSPGSANGRFSSPYDTAFDGTHDYVADFDNNRIQKFKGASFVSQWPTHDNPTAIAFDPASGLLVVGYGDGWIQLYNSFGGYGAYMADIGGTVGGVAVGADGSFWVTDTINNRMRVYSSAGILLATHGTFGSGAGNFDDPRGVAVAANGEVFVADFGNNRIAVWANVTRTETVPAETEVTVPATSNPRLFGGVLLVQATPRA